MYCIKTANAIKTYRSTKQTNKQIKKQVKNNWRQCSLGWAS